MKIAVMVRGAIPIPRPADVVYTPIDVAATIAKGIAKKGHKVDFYGPTGSQLGLLVHTKTRRQRALVHSQDELQSLTESNDLMTHYMPGLWDHYLALQMFQRAAKGEYDLLHFHHPESVISIASLFPSVPVVYTMHDSLNNWHPEIFKKFRSHNQHCISVSDSQRALAPDLPYAATIYNGISPRSWQFSDEPGNYLLFVGRVTPEKGIKEAVDIARMTGERLVIIGPLQTTAHRDYFNKYVEPYLNDRIIYLGAKTRKEVKSYFQKAKALLMPIKWEEPFGMTMVEAMACGTPVIALRRGSVPEVVKDGVTGFAVDTVEQMTQVIKKIGAIDRHACREHVIANFSVSKMVHGYEKTFQAIMEESRLTKPARLRRAISGNLYNTVHAQQTILRLPGRAGSLPDLPAQL